MKRYDSYKDSGVEWIGEIPSEWECIRLGMLGTFSSSGIDKKSNEDETPVRMVNYTDLIKGRKYYPIQNGQKKYMRVTTPQSKFKEHKLKKGDMVFIPSSETHEDLGYSSLIDFEEDDFVYSYHILRYKTKKPIYHYYKKYLINHHSVLNQFSSECKGTTRKIIGRDVFNNVRVVLPPLSEQQQIVSFLDTKTSLIDSLIEKTQRKIELLKEKRTSLINEVVTKGLNPNVEMKDSGVEWIGEIPNHWEKSKFKFHSEIVTGNTPSKKKEELYYTDDKDGLPWVKPTRLDQGFNFVFKSDQYLTDEGKSETRVIPKNSILVCSIGNTLGKFGISGCEMSTNQQINSVICDENTLFHRFCLFFVSVLTEDLIKWTNFVTLPIFTKSDFEDTEIIIPPLSEQQQIVSYLDEQTQLIDKTISIEEKRIELLKEYRQSLISEVVTGKRKVTTDE
jgi:type I restriction enzyme, S subunit